MHDILDTPGLFQISAAIGGTTAVGVLLVRVLEQLVTSRRQSEERKLALDIRTELQHIRDALNQRAITTEQQHHEHLAEQHLLHVGLAEIATTLRERGP